VHIFGGRETPAVPGQGMAYDQIRDRLDSALTAVFTEDGKRTVLYYMAQRYSVSLEQASRDPVQLEYALTNLLGEIGWMVVKRKILERLSGQQMGNDLLTVERTSLREAFGAFHSLMSGMRSAFVRM